MMNVIIEKIRELFHKIRDVKVKDVLSFFSFAIAFPVSCIFRYFHNDLWLVCENENEARDNGYWFFKYVVENHPEQEIIYAIDFKSPDFEKVKKLGKVVQTTSLKHWIYYLSASKNISSQKGDGKPNAAICYVLEVLTGLLKNKRIFLGHGITINDAKWLYYNNTKFSMFLCGSVKEKEFVKEKFGYPKEIIQYLGLPRMDNLHNINVNKKQILVMPTWRNWLVMKRTNEDGKLPEFTQTDYFKNWQSFLKNRKLNDFLECNDLKLIFYPHRNLQQFLHLFKTECSNIVIADSKKYDVQSLLKESALLITDYSSVFMDFIYMRKPVIFYQFDLQEFREKQYQQGYFDYSNNKFAKTFKNVELLQKKLKYYYDNNFNVDQSFFYEHRCYFSLFDDCNSKRIFDFLKA